MRPEAFGYDTQTVLRSMHQENRLDPEHHVVRTVGRDVVAAVHKSRTGRHTKARSLQRG
jgi:hypothetical protein